MGIVAAYYNEIDPEKAEWLREVIKAGIAAPGDVDERSICDVQPGDLRGYTQCHFFAGIGVWSYALRLAGWPDDRAVWTGSCPCPSFSCAGKGLGFDDPRHLWPDWDRLIEISRPPAIFGEQSDDAIGYGWLDLVQTDLEKKDYAVGKAVLGSCSVGATDIRKRLYWVGNANAGRCEQRHPEIGTVQESGTGCELGGLADSVSQRGCGREPRSEDAGDAWEPGETRGMANTSDDGHVAADGLREEAESSIAIGQDDFWKPQGSGDDSHADALKGFWRGADWLFCTDGFWRPVEAGTFPLGHGSAARLLRLRGYGDAINPWTAKEFIESYLES